jgi:uncharacterized protein with PIN domain
MTLDATALLAVYRRTDGWQQLVASVIDAGTPRVSATALAEAAMVLVAEDDNLLDVLDLQQLVTTLKLTVVPFTEADWVRSVHVYQDRRRSGGPGSARFGECLTAAVAARTGTTVMVSPE